jgi:hypothetical protein
MKPKVILKHCDSYDSQQIKNILLEGMDQLGVHPQGRTLIKPNLVMPHKRYFSGCYTRPEFMDGLIGAIKARGEGITDLTDGDQLPFRTCGTAKVISPMRVLTVLCLYPLACLFRSSVRLYSPACRYLALSACMI